MNRALSSKKFSLSPAGISVVPDFLARHSSKSHSSFAYKTSFSGRTHLMTKLKASMHSRLSNFDVKFSLKLEKNHSSSDILLLHSLFSLLNVPMRFCKCFPSIRVNVPHRVVRRVVVQITIVIYLSATRFSPLKIIIARNACFCTDNLEIFRPLLQDD